MEKTIPLFAVGEVVIIFPIYPGPAIKFKGMATTILTREWMKARTYLCESEWCWGYITDVLPPTYYADDGVLCQPTGWTEYNLRKKHAPGMSYKKLMSELNAPIKVKETA